MLARILNTTETLKERFNEQKNEKKKTTEEFPVGAGSLGRTLNHWRDICVS
jgi:hypothetical protein